MGRVKVGTTWLEYSFFFTTLIPLYTETGEFVDLNFKLYIEKKNLLKYICPYI
jgi:hypothetical protein